MTVAIDRTKPGTIDEARRSFLLSGDNARTTHGHVTLQVKGDSFVLSAPRASSHALLIVATDAARLDAHWQGYCARHACPVAAKKESAR